MILPQLISAGDDRVSGVVDFPVMASALATTKSMLVVNEATFTQSRRSRSVKV